MPENTSNFTTKPKKITSSGEFAWGGEAGWSEDIADRTGVTIESGVAVPTRFPTDGLLARWKLTEYSGDAIDHANGHNGTVYGPQQGVSVDGRTAYTFDGDNDYIVTADSALDFTGAFTISLWWKNGSDSNRQRALDKRDDSGYGYEVVPRNDVVSVSLGDGNVEHNDVGTTVITDDEWYHIVAVVEAASSGTRTVTAFVNGEVDGESEFSIGNDLTSSVPLQIGGDGFNDRGYYPGSLSHILMYTRTLNGSDVQHIYDATR